MFKMSLTLDILDTVSLLQTKQMKTNVVVCSLLTILPFTEKWEFLSDKPKQG